MDRVEQRKERLDLCFKHPSCKTCPRNEECEKENGGDTIERKTNTKTGEIHTKHSQWYEPKTSIQRSL